MLLLTHGVSETQVNKLDFVIGNQLQNVLGRAHDGSGLYDFKKLGPNYHSQHVDDMGINYFKQKTCQQSSSKRMAKTGHSSSAMLFNGALCTTKCTN
jgi:hypothetical protein